MSFQVLRRPIFDAIQDPTVRESMQWIYEYLLAIPLLKGNFEHFEVTFSTAVTNEKVNHNLGYAPKDIIVTSQIGAGVATFNYSRFDENFLDITTTGAVVVRFFGGTYEPSNIR